MDGETSEIAGDPAAVELFGHGGGGAGTAEAVEDEVAFVAAETHNTVQKRLRLLSVVPNEFIRLRVNHKNIIPKILNWLAYILV